MFGDHKVHVNVRDAPRKWKEGKKVKGKRRKEDKRIPLSALKNEIFLTRI